MRRLTANMIAFREDPENPARIVVASARKDEIGMAERELAAMQHDLASMLAAEEPACRARARGVEDQSRSAQPAVLGPAVLRPAVEPARPEGAALCAQADAHARARHRVLPIDAVLWAGAGAAARPQAGPPRGAGGGGARDDRLPPDASIGWIVAIERGLTVDADQEQLFRVMLNLARNAVQALESRAPNDAARDQLRITGRREGAVAVIEVSDTGPGLSPKARTHLFEAFQGSSRTGGSGLGLAIAAELIRAHGGEIAAGRRDARGDLPRHHPGPRGGTQCPPQRPCRDDGAIERTEPLR